MPVWQVVLLVNLTLAVGLGLGYADWGRRAGRLYQELEATRARVEQLERERAACTTGARAGEQQWEARGIVRAILPRADLLVITHEEIRGFLPPRRLGIRPTPAIAPSSLQLPPRSLGASQSVTAAPLWTGRARGRS